jgi:hypothetical protein
MAFLVEQIESFYRLDKFNCTISMKSGDSFNANIPYEDLYSIWEKCLNENQFQKIFN